MTDERRTRGLPHGGGPEIDREAARAIGEAWLARIADTRNGATEPEPVNATRAQYAAATGATNLTPSGPQAGVPTAWGRVWAEARSVTTSSGSSVDVVVVAGQNGVRAIIMANEGATVTGGSVRFWTFDPATQVWALGGVEETLPTGARAVATTDQFVTVGAR